jgi:hypothetical protein
MNELQAHLLVDPKGGLSESPQWSSAEEALYWVDIENGLLHRFEWRHKRHECVSLPGPVTMVISGPPLLVTSGNSLLRDVDGNLWIALVKGRRVSCFSPDTGDELARINIDAAKVCACCFAGPEMKHLVITTGRGATTIPQTREPSSLPNPGPGASSPLSRKVSPERLRRRIEHAPVPCSRPSLPIGRARWRGHIRPETGRPSAPSARTASDGPMTRTRVCRIKSASKIGCAV